MNLKYFRQYAQLINRFWWVPVTLLVLVGCASHRAEHAAAVPVANPSETSSEYDSRYRYPLISPGTQFAELPPAVQRTIRAETGGSAIFDIQKNTNSDGGMVYRVIFENDAVLPPLYIAPNGSLLHPDLSLAKAPPVEAVGTKTAGPSERVTMQDLPPQVVKAIQAQAPDAEVGTLTKETQGNQVIYIVTFKDRMHAPLRLAPDGMVLRDSGH